MKPTEYNLPTVVRHVYDIDAFEIIDRLRDRSKSFVSQNTEEDFLSTEQAASFLKISIAKIYFLAKRGDLPFFSRGKRKFGFLKNELEKFKFINLEEELLIEFLNEEGIDTTDHQKNRNFIIPSTIICIIPF